MKQYLPLIGLFVVIVGLMIFGSAAGVAPWSFVKSPAQTTVTIGELKIKADIVKAKKEQQKGLGGREKLAEEGGMLFVFDKENKYNFWMKDVKFPIDIIWISKDKKVVDFYQKAGAQLGVPDSQLRIYSPSSSALYVLEVNAGEVEKYHIGVGNEVKFTI